MRLLSRTTQAIPGTTTLCFATHKITVEHSPMLGVVKSLLSGVSTLSASCSVTDKSVLPAIVLGCVHVQLRTQITAGTS